MKLFLLLVLLFVSPLHNAQNNFTWQTGDLVFQDLDCGTFCDAIKKVTVSANGKHFSHIGIVDVENDSVFVLEAGGHGVVRTPIDTFLQRSLNDKNQPKVVVGRVKDKYKYIIPKAIRASDSLLGKAYDNYFDINNDKYYCSELIYYAFTDNSGKSLFNLAPMTFIDPDSHKTFPAWTEYFKELGVPIPEGKPGLNPGGISRSGKIKIVYSFY